MHGHTTEPIIARRSADGPVARRIAELSEEYLKAPLWRRQEIGDEIAGLITGRIIPFSPG